MFIHFFIFFEQKFYFLTVYRYICSVGWLNKTFDSYIKYNFHVGLALLALAQITALDFGFSLLLADQMIFFIAPFLGYNFIKFHLLFLNRIVYKISRYVLLIGFSFLCALLFIGGILHQPFSSQILLFSNFILVLLYCLPLPGLKINFRRFKGLKIHFVALSWVMISVFLPLSMDGKNPSYLVFLYGFQRYLFVLVATLPFEIRDLKSDDPNLSTWPQKLGVRKTQMLGAILLLLFAFLEVYSSMSSDFIIPLGVGILLMGFVLKSKVEQSKYFSSFWVEGIPILWLLLKYISR